jgi:hypothetical protein
MGTMVSLMLRHHGSGSRTESSTMASGFSASSSRQKNDAGQSSAAPYPDITRWTPDKSPASAWSQSSI